MVATVNVQRITGPSGSKVYTTVTSVRLRTDDANTADTTNPIPIPSSSFKYSYWASICLDLSGTFTKINNVRHYSDGTIGWTFGTGGELRRGNRDTGDKGCPDASYQQAAGAVGDTGYSIEDATNGHAYFNGQTTKTVNIQNDVVGSPATIDSGDHTTPEKTKHVVLQVKVASDATQGTQTAETLTFKYDEI